MAQRLVSVDDNYLFPTPLEVRLATKMTAAVTDSAVASRVNEAQTGAAIDQRITTQATPLVQPIVADYIASSQVVIDAAAAAVDANPAIASLNLGNMRKGNLSVAPNWDTFFDWGTWNASASVGSTFTALPPEARGAGVLVNWESGPSYISQIWHLINANGGGMWRRTKFGATISPFEKITTASELAKITPYAGFISGNTAGTNLDTLLPSAGAQYKWWNITSNPTGIANMPGKPWTGQVEAFTSGNRRIATQRVTYDDGSGIYTRSLFDTDGSGVFNRTSEWRQLNNQPDSGRRELLVDAARRRRGGTIGVGNKAVFAFRYDHWLTDFKAKVMPIHAENDVPASQAIIPSLVGTPTNNMTWAELQDWCLDSGGELINHGLGDHVSTNLEADYVREIREGLAGIQAGTPRLAIEGFNPPGVVSESWGGYSPMDTYDRHETYAAQVILNNHAVVSGYIGNVYRDLDGSNPIGPAHLTIDGTTASAVKAVMDRMVKTGMGGVFMLHPNMLDQAGKMTTAGLAEIIAYAAQLRDEGKAEILSQTGLHFADTGSSRRSDWVWNGDFTDGLTDWTGTGYSVVTEGGLTFARSTDTASILSQELVVPDIGLGSQRELVYEVRATAGATVRTKIGAVAKNIVVPASPEWQTVRAFATIPLDYALPWLTVEVGRNAIGGPVDVANVRLQSI